MVRAGGSIWAFSMQQCGVALYFPDGDGGGGGVVGSHAILFGDTRGWSLS